MADVLAGLALIVEMRIVAGVEGMVGISHLRHRAGTQCHVVMADVCDGDILAIVGVMHEIAGGKGMKRVIGGLSVTPVLQIEQTQLTGILITDHGHHISDPAHRRLGKDGILRVADIPGTLIGQKHIRLLLQFRCASNTALEHHQQCSTEGNDSFLHEHGTSS